MKLLITGGAGYIGTELIHRLMVIDDIETIRIYDNLDRKNYNLFIGRNKLDDKVTFVEGELLDSYTLRKEVTKADAVIHLAAKVTTPFADQNPHLFDQVNNWGSAELAYAVEESGCERVIHLSSTSVYGSTHSERSEIAKPEPKTFYGISKLKSEKHFERLKDKKRVSIIRCANVYGYSRSVRFDAVINKFTLNARHHKRLTIHGNGEQKRAFVHIDRVALFIEKLLLSPAPALYYDLVDRNLSVNDIAYTLKDIMPDVEMLYIDQQLVMRQISVPVDPRVTAMIGEPETTFAEDLRGFLGQLA